MYWQSWHIFSTYISQNTHIGSWTVRQRFLSSLESRQGKLVIQFEKFIALGRDSSRYPSPHGVEAGGYLEPEEILPLRGP